MTEEKLKKQIEKLASKMWPDPFPIDKMKLLPFGDEWKTMYLRKMIASTKRETLCKYGYKLYLMGTKNARKITLK